MHPALAIPELQGLDRQVFQVLRNHPSGLTQAQIVRYLGSSPPSQSSVSRSLARLAASGIVVKHGKTRDASFHLTPEAAWFSAPDRRRSRVPYDPARISAYSPNGTPWLPDAEAERMRSAVPSDNLQLDPSTFSREIYERFLLEMSWASSALEGNTYTLLETEVLIKFAERAEGRSAEEATMILNHKDAIGWLLDNIAAVPLDATTALRLHALLMRGLVNPANLGAVRQHGVGITNSAYEPSSDRIELSVGLSELCAAAGRASDPFEASFALLIGIAYLQPFADGNKRVGRLMSNIPLLQAGLPPLSFVGVDRKAYSAGMLSWYELADPTHIAAAVADGYVESAPAYHVAAVSRRVPRSVEIRERDLFDRELANYMRAYVEGDRSTPGEYADAAFGGLREDERAILISAFQDVVEAMDEVRAVAYRVPRDVFSAYDAARQEHTPR